MDGSEKVPGWVVLIPPYVACGTLTVACEQSKRHEGQRKRAAPMQETIDQPLTVPVATDALVASAEHASKWAGEPFLHPDEDPAQVLAPGTARRKALEDALAEIEAGHKSPTSDWKIRYSLMLGLERVLSDRPPHLSKVTETV